MRASNLLVLGMALLLVLPAASAATTVDVPFHVREHVDAYPTPRGNFRMEIHARGEVVVTVDSSSSTPVQAQAFHYCIHAVFTELPYDWSDISVTAYWGDAAQANPFRWDAPPDFWLCHDYAPALGSYWIRLEVVVHREGCVSYWCGYPGNFEDYFPVFIDPLSAPTVDDAVSQVVGVAANGCYTGAAVIGQTIGRQVLDWGSGARQGCTEALEAVGKARDPVGLCHDTVTWSGCDTLGAAIAFPVGIANLVLKVVRGLLGEG